MSRQLLVLMVLWAGCMYQATDAPPKAKSGPAEPEVKMNGEMHVRLRFSVTELDPKDPKDAYVECLVQNGTDQFVYVPTVYDCWHDLAMMMIAEAEWPMALTYWSRQRSQEYVRLAPAKELAVFKASLKEILLDPMANRPGERKVHWSWEA